MRTIVLTMLIVLTLIAIQGRNIFNKLPLNLQNPQIKTDTPPKKIIDSTPEELSKLPGIGVTSAKRLIYGANALMKKGLEILGDAAKAQAKKSKDLKVTDITGVGAKTAMLLKEGGFDSVGKIFESTPERLSKVPGIGVATAKKLIQGAKDVLEQEEQE